MSEDAMRAITPKPFEKKERKNKKQARARVRCPYCWEALRLTDTDDADGVVTAHTRKCWWLEKNGKGHLGKRVEGIESPA